MQELHSLLVHLFWTFKSYKLILSALIVDSISMTDMVSTLSTKFMTVNIKLFPQTLARVYSIIHTIRQTILSPVYDF